MENKINIIIAGDFCPINRISNWESYKETFSDLKNYLSNFDICIANLECPVSDRNLSPIIKTGPNIICNQKSASLLDYIGINLVTLANNHIMDYGKDGLKDSLSFLKDSNIAFVGADLTLCGAVSTRYFVKNDIKLAVINVTENEWSTTFSEDKPGAHPIDPILNYYTIADAKKNSDFVLLISHGGHEMYNLPSPQIKKLFHFFVDSGVDAIVNHHSHVISGFEIYKNKPIYYSSGNFLFDLPNKRDDNWTNGLFVNLVFSDKGIQNYFKSFKQSTQDKLFYFDNENDKIVAKIIGELNNIITDDYLLQSNFESYIKKIKPQYLNYIAPISNRYLNFLKNKNILPSLLNKKRKKILLNLIRSKAHREVLINILSDEISNS